MKLKYVIVKKDGQDIEVPIIFAELLDHRSVVPYDTVVVSAGFVEIFAGTDGGYRQTPIIKVFCYGESKSLCVGSRMNIDEAVIDEYLDND